jgi:hypothetical protein
VPHSGRITPDFRLVPKGDITTWWGPRASAHANPLHQESRVDALILLNDMTSFPPDEQQPVHTGASNR